MPRAKELTRYPREYVDLLVAASNPALGPDGLRITLDNPGQAASFRSQVYAFIRAFEKAYVTEQQRFPELSKELVGSVYIRQEENVLVFANRQFTPTVQKIREALAALGKPVGGPTAIPVPDADAMLERIQQATAPNPFYETKEGR